MNYIKIVYALVLILLCFSAALSVFLFLGALASPGIVGRIDPVDVVAAIISLSIVFPIAKLMLIGRQMKQGEITMTPQKVLLSLIFISVWLLIPVLYGFLFY